MATQAPIHILHQNFCRGGGMEQYALLLAKTFSTLGHPIRFHSRNSDPVLAEQTGCRVEPLRMWSRPRKLRDLFYFRAVGKLSLPVNELQIALSRVRSKDIVICGGTHLGYMRHTGRLMGPFDRLQVWLEREAYRSAKVVVSHSKLCTDELLTLYALPSAKVHTIFPPLESRLIPCAPEAAAAARKKLGLPADKVIFLFPSLGHRRKGLGRLCEALAPFAAEAVLAVAGRPAAAYRKPFVHQLGYVHDIAEAYWAADYTTLASSYEPFGLVGPESIACGTRIVFDKDIGCLAAINPEAALTFSWSDLDSMRQAMAAAIALARKGAHRLPNPAQMLLYNTDPRGHAEALLRTLSRGACAQAMKP